MNYASKKEQIRIYVGKFFRNFRNEKGWVSLIGALIIPFLACAVAGKEAFSTESATRTVSFILVSACIWIGIFNSLTVVCKEREIIKHEYREGLDLSAYIAAHMIFQGFLAIAETVIVSGVTFAAYHENISRIGKGGALSGFRFAGLFITFLLAIYAADLLGILVSSIVRKSETAMAVMPFILVLQLVFAGNIPLSENLDSVSYLTLSRWGYNAMLDLSDTALRSGWLFKEAAVRFPTCWIALILFTALYAFLARTVLKLIDRDGR